MTHSSEQSDSPMSLRSRVWMAPFLDTIKNGGRGLRHAVFSWDPCQDVLSSDSPLSLGPTYCGGRFSLDDREQGRALSVVGGGSAHEVPILVRALVCRSPRPCDVSRPLRCWATPASLGR